MRAAVSPENQECEIRHSSIDTEFDSETDQAQAPSLATWEHEGGLSWQKAGLKTRHYNFKAVRNMVGLPTKTVGPRHVSTAGQGGYSLMSKSTTRSGAWFCAESTACITKR